MKACFYLPLILTLLSCKNGKNIKELNVVPSTGPTKDSGQLFIDSMNQQAVAGFYKSAQKTDHVYKSLDSFYNDDFQKSYRVTLFNPYKKTIKSVLLMSYNSQLQVLGELVVKRTIKPGQQISSTLEYLNYEPHVLSTVFVKFTDNTVLEVNPGTYFQWINLKKK